MILNTYARLRAVLLALALVGALATAVGAATAQEVPTDPLNDTETPTPAGEQVQDQLGNLVVHDYSYNGQRMRIHATWQGRGTTQVTLTEMVELESGGSQELSFKQVRLVPEERTTITIAVEQRSSGEAAVLLTTDQSFEDDDVGVLVLQAGSPSNSEPVPFQWAVIAVGLAAIGGGGGSYLLTRRGRDEEDEWRERVA
jgi:hypothetical protein